MKVKKKVALKKGGGKRSAKKIRKKVKSRNNNNIENEEDLTSQSSILLERREALARESRVFVSVTKDVDEAGIYELECSKQNCLPIGYYMKNIRAPVFRLRYANIGPDEFLPVSLSLGRNECITKLDLSNNQLGDEGLYYLSQAIYENSNFEEIIVANNKISSKMVEPFCDAISVSAKVKLLNLSENQIDDSAATFIADLMLTSPSLHTLNISKNKFSENSVAHFGRGIAETECLKILDISWNHIVCSGKGIKRLSKGLSTSKLEILNYSFNQIGPTAGCMALMKGLKANRYLKELDLSDNIISLQGCLKLSKAFQYNKSLTKIKFARNPFLVDGCIEILKSVLKNKHSQLTELNFEDISVNQDFMKLVEQSYKQLPNLRIIYGSRPSLIDQEIYSLNLFGRTEDSTRKWTNALQKLQKKFNRPLMPALLEVDRDKDMTLSRIELIEALELYFKPLGISLTQDELRGLLTEIDPENTNKIAISAFSGNSGAKNIETLFNEHQNSDDAALTDKEN